MSTEGWSSYTPSEKRAELARRKRKRAEYRRERAALPVEEIEAETELMDNVRAARAAEDVERAQLRRWLQAYAHILSDPIPVEPTVAVVAVEETYGGWLSGACGNTWFAGTHPVWTS